MSKPRPISRANVPQIEVIHPSWPVLWPRMLKDGKTYEYDPKEVDLVTPYDYPNLRPLTKKAKQFLWECE